MILGGYRNRWTDTNGYSDKQLGDLISLITVTNYEDTHTDE
jgi:hypothetical protein